MYKMYKIILMLSTIVPSLGLLAYPFLFAVFWLSIYLALFTDCCSSRTLFHRKPMNLYRAIEVSLEKSTQFQQNNPQDAQIPTPLTVGDEPTTLSHRHHHLHYDNGEESDEDEENLKLNRSQRSDLQNEEAQLEKQLGADYVLGHHRDDDDDGKSQVNSSTEMPVMEDAQYKLMNEIVSMECVEWFRLEFCLNGGRCFLYPILNQSLSSCECAEGYVGERCEAKSFEFIPRIRPRFVLAKTMGGPLVFGLAVIDILFLLFLFCKKCNRD